MAQVDEHVGDEQRLAELGYKQELTRAWSSFTNFAISKLVKLDYAIYSVPITYNVREGETKIESLKDGLKILLTLSRNLFWAPSNASVTAQVRRGTNQSVSMPVV